MDCKLTKTWSKSNSCYKYKCLMQLNMSKTIRGIRAVMKDFSCVNGNIREVFKALKAKVEGDHVIFLN